jgi:dethiobiotin synthetase
MVRQQARGLFIAGTDTEVGKTFVAARIAAALHRQGRRVGVYKPVASGCRIVAGKMLSDDALQLWEAAGRPGSLDAVCPQLFAAPLAPPQAAREAGRAVDAELLRAGLAGWLRDSEIVLVEGVGGLMSPISDEDYVVDLAADFGFPLIVVAPNALGVINQTLQTLITAATFRDGLEIAGVVLNHIRPPSAADRSIASNRSQLEQRCVPPVLAELGWQADGFDADVDWYGLAGQGRSESE